jgi:hypothetical protein
MKTTLRPGGSLPESDHALRYIRRKFVDRNANQIAGSAFLSRPAERHDGPSVNWMEFFDGDIGDRIREIWRLRRMRYEKHARVALLNVGQTKEYLNDLAQREIEFIYDPLSEDAEQEKPADPSHAYMSNIPVDDLDSPEAESIGDLVTHCVIHSWPVSPD